MSRASESSFSSVDVAVLIVSLCSVLLSFQGSGKTTLKPSWVHSTDPHLGFGGLPPPVVGDFDQAWSSPPAVGRSAWACAKRSM